MHGDNPLRSYSLNDLRPAGIGASNILSKQPGKKLTGLEDLSGFSTLGSIPCKCLPGKDEDAVTVSDQALEYGGPFYRVVPVQSEGAFETRCRSSGGSPARERRP